MQAFCQCISPGNSTFRRPGPLPHTPFSTGRGRPACFSPPCRSKTPRHRPFLSGPGWPPDPQKECSRFPISGPCQTSTVRAGPPAAPPFPAPSIHQTVYMISLEMSSFPIHLPFPLCPSGPGTVRDKSSCESGASLSDVSYYQYMQDSACGAGQAGMNQKKPGRIMPVSCPGSYIGHTDAPEKGHRFEPVAFSFHSGVDRNAVSLSS